jgi:RNA polymerase sigma-70 factor (ECF subfamily)
VFVTALERIGDLRDGAAFGGWLLAMARTRAVDLRRKPRLLPVSNEVAALAAPAADGAATIDAATALVAIRELPEAFRETLLMRLVEGMTGPDIAARTGMTHGSVRVNLHRGMTLLRERLGVSHE